MVAKKEDEDYRRPLNKAYDESARGIGNVVGKTADALLGLPQLTYAGGAVKDIYNKGFMNTLGRVYDDSITGATNIMEGTANVLGGAGRDVSRMATEAGKQFRSGAGIESVDQPAYGNINEQFTAGEAQLNRLDDAQIAPTSTDAMMLEGQDLTPGNMTQAEINTLKYGPVQNFQPEPGFKGIEGIGGENIYRNTNVDPKKYGQAIYSDTIQGALPSGFDKDIREQGIGVTDPETGVTNTPFSRTAQQNGIGQQTDPARQAYDKANQLMSQMPYGNPGDRQKRANLVAQARTFVGIAGGLQQQTEAGRQYGIDVFNTSNPSSVSQIGRFKNVAAIPPSSDDQGNYIPGTPGYRYDSTTGQDVETAQQAQAKFATPMDLWEAHKSGKIGRKESNDYIKKYFPELALEAKR